MLVHPSVHLPYIHPSFHPYFGLQTITSKFQWIFTKLCMFIIPPTYEVCGGIFRMSGYIVFAFPFVRSFVRTYIRSFVHLYVRSFVFPSQGQSFCVKVYKTSYFEDPLMDFIHIWHDGRYRSKVFISTIPTLGVTLGSRSQT